MKKINGILIFFIVNIAMIQCSRPGDPEFTDSRNDQKSSDAESEPKPDPESEEPETPPPNLTTHIRFTGFQYPPVSWDVCAGFPGLPLRLIERADEVTIDGVLSDWASMEAALRDPLEGGLADISDVYISLNSGRDLLIAASGNFLEHEIIVELGGMRNSAEGPEFRTLRRFQALDSRVSDWINGAYAPLPESDGRVARTASGVEILIKGRWISEVYSWPVWWLRMKVSHPTGVDQTAILPLDSILEPGNDTFGWQTCGLDIAGQKVQFVSIAPKSLPDDLRNTGTLLTKFAFREIERLLSESAVSGLQSVPFPYSHMLFFLEEKSPLRVVGLGSEQSGYLGLGRAQLDALLSSNPEIHAERVFFQTLLSRYLRMRLNPDLFTAPVLSFLSQLIYDELVIRLLGEPYWLDYARMVLAVEDVDAQDSLASRFHLFARLAGGRIQRGHLTAQILEAARNSAPVDMNAVKTFLLDELGESEGQRLWGEGIQSSAENLLAKFQDQDRDGIPNYLESIYGTDASLPDTDADGWGDLVEVVNQSNPENHSITPKQIYPDGDFREWLSLLPAKLGIDEGGSVGCPRSANIENFGALVSGSAFIVGALSEGQEASELPLHWELVIELLQSKRRLYVTLQQGKHTIEVRFAGEHGETFRIYRRAMPQGYGTFEVFCDIRAFGIEDVLLSAPGAVRFKIQTVQLAGQKTLCDETEWFSPVISLDHSD